MWCPDNYDFIKDYEPLRALIASLQTGLGVRYRIAYMQTYATDNRVGIGASVMTGNAHDCRAASGLALLYNPNRIRNVMADTSQADADGAFSHNHNRNRTYLRRSLPCCDPRPGQEGVCMLIDAPIQNDRCGPTPAGLALTAVGDIAVARLARADNTEFRVYNVHIDWAGDPGYLQGRSAVRTTVDSVESQIPRWIPPVMVGDFNNGYDFNNGPETVREWLGDFEYRGGAPLDDFVYTLTGTASRYTSGATMIRHETVQLPPGATEAGCKDAGRLWSDHCGVITTLVIQN
jgi:hypothetical protein